MSGESKCTAEAGAPSAEERTKQLTEELAAEREAVLDQLQKQFGHMPHDTEEELGALIAKVFTTCNVPLQALLDMLERFGALDNEEQRRRFVALCCARHDRAVMCTEAVRNCNTQVLGDSVAECIQHNALATLASLLEDGQLQERFDGRSLCAISKLLDEELKFVASVDKKYGCDLAPKELLRDVQLVLKGGGAGLMAAGLRAALSARKRELVLRRQQNQSQPAAPLPTRGQTMAVLSDDPVQAELEFAKMRRDQQQNRVNSAMKFVEPLADVQYGLLYQLMSSMRQERDRLTELVECQPDTAAQATQRTILEVTEKIEALQQSKSSFDQFRSAALGSANDLPGDLADFVHEDFELATKQLMLAIERFVKLQAQRAIMYRPKLISAEKGLADAQAAATKKQVVDDVSAIRNLDTENYI